MAGYFYENDTILLLPRIINAILTASLPTGTYLLITHTVKVCLKLTLNSWHLGLGAGRWMLTSQMAT